MEEDAKGNISKNESSATQGLQAECQHSNPNQHDVKSFAVVKYSAMPSPAPFSELQHNTNLNQPPANWLRATPAWQGLKGNWAPGSNNSTMFSSFHMANDYPDCVGEVDVISDAENIKKLLKIPYSSAPVSMMVHRIGNTLLLDDFDIHRYLIREAQDEWKWLRSFCINHVLQSMRERQKTSLFPRERKSRDHLLNKSMFSKFLYYSVPEEAAATQLESKSNSSVQLESESPSTSQTAATSQLSKPFQLDSAASREDSERTAAEDSEEAGDVNLEVLQLEREVESSLTTMVEQNRTIDHHLIPSIPEPPCITEAIGRSSGFQRNVVWTFEDIQMLVGTDMPIFGDGNHPCITLKLSDMDQPINVLTGMDYWLDNLMCNVPEVVMCFHQNGIVKKYDVFKTEDIPKMENCKFSPVVVKDVAQNILSFLKSKAAKSGHTYWLFKAKDDDVVKLYDLTTELAGSQSENPFTVPVAMLFYNVASNLKKLYGGKQKREIICTLLKNCLKLLDKERYSQVYSYALFLLSDLYIPADISPSSPNFSDCSSDDDEEDDGLFHLEQEGEEVSSSSPTNRHIHSPSMNIKALCYPNAWTYNPQKPKEKVKIGNLSPEARCKHALQHLAEGLTSLDRSLQEGSKKEAGECKPKEEFQRMARPYQAIPLRYSSLNEPAQSSDASTASSVGNWTQDLTVTSSSGSLSPDSWQCCYKILLLEKASVTSLLLAVCAVTANKQGRAMHYIKLALLCYDGVRALRQQVIQDHQPGLLSCILTLAGDIHLSLVHSRPDLNSCREEYNSWHSSDNDICNSVYLHLTQDHEYEWVSELSINLEHNYELSKRCYEAAQEGSLDPHTLRKKLGNMYNELAALYLSRATELCQANEGGSLKVKEMCETTYDLLQKGQVMFRAVGDEVNSVVIYLNLGRLMRVQAHYQSQVQTGTREVGAVENKYYNRAIGYYESALLVLGSKDSNPGMWEAVEWNLSTTLFTLATLLQDYSPLSRKAHQQVEQDISDLMKKTLLHCDIRTAGPNLLLYQFRVALVHHKLGSLYHNSYRNQFTSEQRKKQLSTEAQTHYQLAMEMYARLERIPEFQHVQLEAVGLCEYMYQELSGFASKTRALLSAIRNVMAGEQPMAAIETTHVTKSSTNKNSANDVTTNQKSAERDVTQESTNPDDEDEENEVVKREKMAAVLMERLGIVLENMRKLHSGGKGGKSGGNNKAVVEVVDKMRGVLNSTAPSRGSAALLKVLNKLRPHVQRLESLVHPSAAR